MSPYDAVVLSFSSCWRLIVSFMENCFNLSGFHSELFLMFTNLTLALMLCD